MTTMRLAFAVAALAAASVSAQQSPEPGTPAFEAVVLKRNTSGSQSMSAGSQPGGVRRVVNGTISTIFGNAYSSESNEVKGAPDWFSTERYDLTARIAGNPTREQEQALWRALFAERMRLKAHHETEERPIYHLVVARADGRLGPKIAKSETDCTARRAAQLRGETVPPLPAAGANGLPPCSARTSGGMLTAAGRDMAYLGRSIQGVAGRMIVDRTGITGDYDFTLEFSTQRPGDTAVDDKPNIFTALQEQLGLRLEPARGPVEFVVIDHIERPTVD
jgi:uncharacterized protein (TIGR03435 family)